MASNLEALYNSYKDLKNGLKPVGDAIGGAGDYVSSLMPTPTQTSNDEVAKTVSDAGSSVGNWLNSFLGSDSKKDNSEDKVSPPKQEVKHPEPQMASLHPLSSKPDVPKPDFNADFVDPRTVQSPQGGDIATTDHSVLTDGLPGIASQKPHVPDTVENLMTTLTPQPAMPTEGPMSPVPAGGIPAPVASAPAMPPPVRQPDQKQIDVDTSDATKALGSRSNLIDAQKSAAASEFVNRIGKSMDIASAGIARTDPSGQKMYDDAINRSGEVVKNYQDQLANEKFDPKSPQSTAFRKYMKSIGAKNLGDNVSAADGEKLYPMIFKGFELEETRKSHAADVKYHADTLAESKRQHDEIMKLAKNQAQSAKEEAHDNDAFTKLTSKVNENMASSRSSFGRNANVVRAAGALKQLIQDTPNMSDWTEAQINEFSKNLDGMLSNGAGTVSGMKGFIPHSFMGDLKKFGSKVLNRPLGMDQARFAQNLMNMVNAEETFAKKNVLDTKGDLLSGADYLAQKYPDKWNRAFGAMGLDAETILNRGKPPAKATAGKTITRKGYNPTTNQTQLIYSDNSSEIKDGKL